VTDPATRSAKRALRREMIARREALADRADAAQRAAAAFPLAGPAPAFVSAYHPMGAELDPGPLLARFVAAGARVLLPVVVEKGGLLVFREAGDPAGYALDLAGLLAPSSSAQARRPDLLLVPLLAFDRFGGRLGYGGGYYDRTLAALRADGPRPLAVGLAFAAQEVDRAPVDALDQPLDAILTETGYRVLV
jgi:5-formyltetrahydrofolate cyclo-ligase